MNPKGCEAPKQMQSDPNAETQWDMITPVQHCVPEDLPPEIAEKLKERYAMTPYVGKKRQERPR